MVTAQLLKLLAVATLALLAASFAPTPANALSRTHHLNRQIPHDAIARRNSKRTNTKRCKQRPSSTSIIASSSTNAAASPKVAAPTSTESKAVPTSTESKAVPTSTESKAVPTSTESKAVPTSTQAKAAPTSTTSKAAQATPKTAAATSTSKTSSPAPSATTSSSNDNASKKVGLAWPNGPVSELQSYSTSSVGWIYTWSPDTPDPSHKSGLEFMPMLWGPNQVEDFESKVVAGYANYILGFNEPNESGQSNLDPGYAAQLWKQHIEPKRALGYQTCSPATSSNPNGFTWMQNFLDACDGGCTIDYMCAHWYDVKASDFQTYVEKWHSIYNKDIFITEFAPQNFNGGAQPSSGDIWSFYQTVMPWIKQTSYVKAAFPFGFMHDMSGVNLADQLMASSGQPTDLGWYIINGDY